MLSSTPLTPSPWPHRWAWLLACATFPLVWWGGFVTATGSGMAFKDWLTSDGVFMPLYPWLSSAGDKFIEHGHRLLGMFAGLLTIALLISLYIAELRRWVRLFGVALLLGVIAQGVLGGMRVVLDERILALIHGCTGPLFFAAAAAMVSVTSRRWHESAAGGLAPTKIFRLALLTAILAYLQLVIGAVVRHAPLMLTESAARVFQIAVYFHVLLAVAVTFHVLLLAHKCFWSRVSRGLSLSLVGLIGVQLLLGVSSWMVKYGMPQWATGLIGETGHFNRASGAASAAIVTAHGAVGSLIVALCVVLALQVARRADLRASSQKSVTAPMARALA
jgi:cytochrome c oxidase assembly protein subunit 15